MSEERMPRAAVPAGSRSLAAFAVVLAVAGVALATVVTLGLASIAETYDLYTPGVGALQQTVFVVGILAVVASVVLAGVTMLRPRPQGRVLSVAALALVSLGLVGVAAIALVGVSTGAG